MNRVARSTIPAGLLAITLPWARRWSFWCLPARCYFCSARGDLGPIDLCSICWASLPWFTDKADAGQISAFRYADPVDQALKALKFSGDRRAARLLGTLLAVAVHGRHTAPELPDLLLPVPLHATRLAQRGFNQALLIARHAAHPLRRPIEIDWLTRVRATQPQTALHAAARRQNVAGAFVVASHLRARLRQRKIRCVALVDDVMTTGATLDAARTVLLEAGVREVQLWSVARAMPASTVMPT